MDENFVEENDQTLDGEVQEVRPAVSSGPFETAPADERASGGRRRYMGRAKVCMFCTEKITKIDYKDFDMLRRFLTERAKIRPRRQTGNCARHQRAVSRAIKRARQLALLPFVGAQTREA